PKQMKCYISPCLSMKNFEIGEEVALRFPTTFINRNIGKKPHLNLKAFLEQELINAGVRKNSIDIDSRCTIDDTSFYSFRRERDKAGRMLAFITQTDN
ncbi:MAG TPA: polyphenol oxidase family protein, partial [Balneolaceae bacterium]|nr:polyphenol oxidase family protein [Balneolaceae bacterium]